MHRRSLSSARRGLVAGVALVALAACGSPPPVPVFQVTFTALSDAVPMPGVQITRDGHPLGVTDANGLLELRLHGQDGTPVNYRVECPQGYRTPPTPPPLVLRQFRSVAVHGQPAAPHGIEITVQCLPMQRYAAVIVRAAGFAGLPVVMSGQPVTLTDSSGVAHFTLPLAPNSSFAVGIDTSSNPAIMPPSPSGSFTIGDADDILVFDPPLHLEVAPVRHVHHVTHTHIPVNSGPIRISSGPRH